MSKLMYRPNVDPPVLAAIDRRYSTHVPKRRVESNVHSIAVEQTRARLDESDTISPAPDGRYTPTRTDTDGTGRRGGCRSV